MYVLRHDDDAFRMYRAQIGIFEETDKARLAAFLEGHHGGALESQFDALLIATDLAKGDRSRPVAVTFLHVAGHRRAFVGGLRRELFTRRRPAGGFASYLLRTGHNCRLTIKTSTVPQLYITQMMIVNTDS
ncbi:hypothetical protein EVAR_43445_1 [Eumeta japonica]|uniref:Uncharacterized protein n=1 Tax=Eumeta variegata TaxID=151549 RepID=A0A4C1YDJ0_EUMVA|nr:hypothetical protein EVAR_43445_1 [Eumeta japonica]